MVSCHKVRLIEKMLCTTVLRMPMWPAGNLKLCFEFFFFRVLWWWNSLVPYRYAWSRKEGGLGLFSIITLTDYWLKCMKTQGTSSNWKKQITNKKSFQWANWFEVSINCKRNCQKNRIEQTSKTPSCLGTTCQPFPKAFRNNEDQGWANNPDCLSRLPRQTLL